MRRMLLVFVMGMLGLASVQADSKRWWSHIAVLADDAMEGRDTGSEGHKRAAQYVASQFEKAGLTPVGSGGFIQPVKFKTRRIIEAQSSLALVRNGATEPLALGEDANISVRIEPAGPVDAPLVFVGYGLAVPELKYDDFADPAVSAALKGAVAVIIAGGPSSIPGPLRSHYQSASERWAALKQAGAIGTISIANPKTMDVPWARQTLARLQPAMTLADTALAETRGAQLAVTMNPAHADKLFAGSGHTFQELLALADAGQPLPRFPLPLRVKATAQAISSEVESQNIIAVAQGSDPKLRDQFVVLSAHVDHLGMGEQPINGDRVFNGAMDNASGVAALIEIATQLHEAPVAHGRSIMFVVVTGEEKGLLGSRYFVAHPPVPLSHIVANVNTDMFLPLFPLKTLMVLGLDESDLGGDIRSVASALKLGVQVDPEPNRNRFIRSDQYSFIRAGIPALAMKVGYEEGTPEAKVARAWIAERYHALSDDLNQPIDLSAAEGYVEVVKRLAVQIANRPAAPKWNDASFFKRFAARPTN
jgi:hypothetical protein